MQIAVLVERMGNNGYRARGGEPFGITAEGATREEALAKLKDEVQAKLRDGGEIVTMEVSPEPHPLEKFAGMFPDDALTREWEEAMAEYPRKVDEAPEIFENRANRSPHRRHSA